VGHKGFFAYFEKNWHSCQEMWVALHRSDLPHYKNTTNNRLESFFGKLKENVDCSMSMAQCVSALVAADRREHKEYKYTLARIGRNVNSSYDEEMSQVLLFTTHFAAEGMEPQYAAGLANADRYNYQSIPGEPEVIVESSKRVYKLCVDDWRCNCEFSMPLRLPCRHAIAYRKHAKCFKLMIPFERIDDRYGTASHHHLSLISCVHACPRIDHVSTMYRPCTNHVCPCFPCI
jgi:hypothetical protein